MDRNIDMDSEYDFESRIVSSSYSGDDSETELSLRPKTLEDYVGQEKAKENLKVYIDAAKKRGDSITFLRKIVRGSTDDSYGIEVAKLAGLPGEVIKRAKEILATVEESAKNIKLTDREEKTVEKDESLISFDDLVNEQIVEEIKNTDINTLSPYECMSLIFDWKKRLQ